MSWSNDLVEEEKEEENLSGTNEKVNMSWNNDLVEEVEVVKEDNDLVEEVEEVKVVVIPVETYKNYIQKIYDNNGNECTFFDIIKKTKDAVYDRTYEGVAVFEYA